MARNNPPSWGLKIPGRPPTPSDGYAQQYDRIGPAETQRLWTFDNGTCLTYGPDDLVDEFHPILHPFCNQVALIDTMIRDTLTVRARYEVSKRQLGRRESAQSEMIGVEEDPFNNFRQQHLDPSALPKVALASGVYTQVPSRFATISNLVSIYSTPNKSDTPGEAHRGLTNDTRFGMSGKPSYNPQLHLAQRQQNIHRLTLQRQFQSGASRGGRRGHGGRHFGPQQIGRIPEQNQRQYDADDQPKAGMSRGQQKMRGRQGPGRGRRNDLIRHERFKSQAFSVADMPLSNFAFPAVNNSTKKFPLQDYEDEGPTIGSAYGHYGDEDFQENEHSEGSFSKADSTDKLNLTGLKLNEGGMYPFRRAENHLDFEGYGQKVATHAHALYGASAAELHGNTYAPPVFYQGTNYSGFSQGSQATRRFEGYLPPVSQFQAMSGSVNNPAMYMGQEINAQNDEDGDQDEDHDEEWQEKANRLFGQYLDELNNESRARGDVELAGDILNGEPVLETIFQGEYGQNRSYGRLPESDGSPTSKNRTRTAANSSIRARRLGQGLAGSSTRPSSPTINSDGRLSGPPRGRPSDPSSAMFGARSLMGAEDRGNLSREPSPNRGGRGRPFKRRLFE